MEGVSSTELPRVVFFFPAKGYLRAKMSVFSSLKNSGPSVGACFLTILISQSMSE